MKKKLKRYRISADDSMGVAMSVVKNPAVQSDFVYFSEQKIENFVSSVEGERRMIYGCALRPDFPIYRNNGVEEYYLEFDKEAIDKISKNYFKMGFQNSWTESHKNEVEGLTITESWIKESMTMDKSILLGLDANLPIGTWFIGCYCENDEIWNAVKSGTYAGFSIEALLSVEEFESQINNDDKIMIEMTNEEMNLFKKFKEWLSSTKEEEIKDAFLESAATTPMDFETLAALSGFTSVEDYKAEVEAIKEELEEEPQPTAVEEPQPTVEEPKVEPTVEEPKPIEEPTQVEEPTVEETPKVDENLAELIKSLKDEINALKEMNDGLNDKVKELSKEPSAKPVNTNAKPNGGGSNYEAWREQLRGLLS